jgi:hypothetical protein
MRSLRSRTVETLSDDTGAFALTDLAPTSYEVRLERADTMFTSIGHGSHSVHARPGEQLEFLARRILNLPVSVRYASGEEARSAVVRCSVEPIPQQQDWNQGLFGEDRSEFSWSPGRPSLRVPAGRLHLRAYAGEEGAPAPAGSALAYLRSESREVLVGEEDRTDPVVLELVRCSGIRGRLTNRGPRQRASFPRVLLLALDPGEEVDLTRLRESEQSVYLPHAEEFGFVGLRAGRYAVGAQRQWGSAIVVHRVVEVLGGITACDLELPPLPEEEVLRVTVLDGEGRPMRLVSFSFTHRSPGSSSSSRGGGHPRDAQGAYLFPIPEASRGAYFGTPPTDDVFLLRAMRPGCGTATAVLVPGQESLTITLEAEAEGSIQALGFSGSGLTGRLSAELLPETGADHDLALHRGVPGAFGADGTVRFHDYVPGLHEVRLLYSARTREPGRWMPARTLASRQVHLEAGENLITLPIPALYTLEVLVEGVPAGTEVLLWEGLGDDALSPVARTVTGEDGAARFADCRAGEYAVGVGGWERRRVMLPCGTLTLRADG